MTTKLNLTVVTRDCSVGGIIPTHLQPLVDLRQGANSVPIIETNGRIRIDSNIFNSILSYEDLTMRRKAEVLQYNVNNAKETNKSLFSKMQFRRKMKNIDRFNECPTVIYPPSNSGIKDVTFSGYYLNKNVPYYPSI